MRNPFYLTKDKPRIKYSKDWNAFIVVINENILYTGTKEMCRTYVDNIRA